MCASTYQTVEVQRYCNLMLISTFEAALARCSLVHEAPIKVGGGTKVSQFTAQIEVRDSPEWDVWSLCLMLQGSYQIGRCWDAGATPQVNNGP